MRCAGSGAREGEASVRIALIAPLVTPIGALHLGGAQAVLADVAGALSRRGHDVVVYAARGSRLDGVTMGGVDVDPTLLEGDLFHPGPAQPASPAMAAAYRRVYGAVRDGGFDLVHNHGFDTPAVTVAAEMDLPVLHTLHLPPTPLFADAIAQARRSTTAAVWCAAVSHAHATSWAECVSLDAVLRDGVPVNEISFQPHAARAAVIAARFSAEKGVDDGIAAARLAGWPVDVYGTPYDAAYEQAIRQRWADDSVRFHAPLRRTELWGALGAAGAALCLSRWEEPFGMTAAEAQAAGTPVLAARVGGLSEVVDDGATGY
ncbi:MAG: hypothetical protein DLM65_07240, partial [Candidatus Aeolococcus gillhamiae]